jgi:Sec-independent protein secretion pathway component TatC
MFSDIIRIFSL